jgi:hypothetical protein
LEGSLPSEDYFFDLTPISITEIPPKIIVIGAIVGVRDP